eukprot:gene6011-8280_t
MSFTSFSTAYLVEIISRAPPQNISSILFCKAAISAALASPIGYASLKYITYPMMILTKSSKPVPVMIIGIFFYGKVYTWFKYVSVLLLCFGISMFTSASKSKAGLESNSYDLYGSLGYGLILIIINLSLDGYTNNEQDQLFAPPYSATSLQMMKNTNFWQSIYQTVYLLLFWLIFGSKSELSSGVTMILSSPELRFDILAFCTCAAGGQILIFGLIKEFGGLVWISVSITRQLFTMLLSVFIFNHQLKLVQWIGMVFVFGGLSLEIIMNYLSKEVKVQNLTTTNSTQSKPEISTPMKKHLRKLVDLENNQASPSSSPRIGTPLGISPRRRHRKYN